MSDEQKKFVITFHLEATRDNVVRDTPSPAAIRIPVYKFMCADLPGDKFAEALGVMLAVLGTAESKVHLETVLGNLARAQDVDDWMLRDVESRARDR